MWLGRVVDDTYRIDREIGSGGFGIVYAAEDVPLSRPVALKVLKPDQCGPRELGYFLTEARNLANLDHSNVVRIHRLGEFESRPYIVMELLNGDTLAQLVRAGRLNIRERLEVMRQVANGLAAMHAIGILHRDLSPRNIMRCENGTVKIFDLGLSRDTRLSRTDSMHVIRGTLAYVSPEQFSGGPTTARSEVYSYGVILYEMLCGETPSVADHLTSLMYNVVHRDPEPIENRLPECTPALAVLVGACLAKRPEDRPASMAEIGHRLDVILSGSGLQEQVPAATTTSSHRPSTSANPYLHRVMIKRREGFFGRRAEVQRIFARLNATPPGSISIVGDRKVGKSSLLNHVYTRDVREDLLAEPDRMVMVYLDLQVEKDMTIPSFVDMVLGLVGLELRGRLDVSGCARSLEGIEAMIQQLGAAGIRLAVLLDEFEVITGNANFDLEFFSFLRYLANHYDVAYLTSSARNLQVLCHTKEISDSPFFNIFSTMRLTSFQLAEAEELIRVPSAKVGKPLEAWTDRVLELSGLFPFYIQVACTHTLEYLHERPGADPDFQDIRQRFTEEAKPHYQYLWDNFDDHEQQAIGRLAQKQRIPDKLRHVVDELTSRRFVIPGDRPRLFSQPFEAFVLEVGQGGSAGSLFDRWFRRPGQPRG